MNRFHRSYMAGAQEMRSRSMARSRAVMEDMSGAEGRTATAEGSCPTLPLAFPYVPAQTFENLYDPMEGWRRGTIFADLDKPYEGGCRA